MFRTLPCVQENSRLILEMINRFESVLCYLYAASLTGLWTSCYMSPKLVPPAIFLKVRLYQESFNILEMNDFGGHTMCAFTS